MQRLHGRDQRNATTQSVRAALKRLRSCLKSRFLRQRAAFRGGGSRRLALEQQAAVASVCHTGTRPHTGMPDRDRSRSSECRNNRSAEALRHHRHGLNQHCRHMTTLAIPERELRWRLAKSAIVQRCGLRGSSSIHRPLENTSPTTRIGIFSKIVELECGRNSDRRLRTEANSSQDPGKLAIPI